MNFLKEMSCLPFQTLAGQIVLILVCLYLSHPEQHMKPFQNMLFKMGVLMVRSFFLLFQYSNLALLQVIAILQTPTYSTYSSLHYTGHLIGLDESQISWDFQRQIHRKIGRFCGNFAEIFRTNFTKNQISWEFFRQISLEVNRFCTDLISKFKCFFNRDNHLLF